MKKIVWGNTIVKNEDRYLWFAVKSVIDYLDKILIWDTGSSDKTVEIINLLKREYPNKIEFREIGEVDENWLTKARQKMLDETKADWFFLLDGDEVWWEEGIKEMIATINQKGDRLDAIATPVINLVGDIYHHQEEEAGKYHILGKKGHFNLRAINRRIPGLHVDLPYGKEGYFDKENKTIQSHSEKIFLAETAHLHFTHLSRSSSINGDMEVMQRKGKRKYEIGIKFSKVFKYPEILLHKRPDIIPSPWQKMTTSVKIRSLIQTPFKKIKRGIFK